MLGLSNDIKVKVVSEEGCLQTLSVELPVSKVKEKIEEAFKNVQSQAKLPGFRPGKAPIELVRENFKGAALEKAQDLLMRDGVMEALKVKKINPVQTPVIQNMPVFVPEKSFQFQFLVEAMPEVKLGSYKGLKLAKKTKTVSNEDVQKSIDTIAESNARLGESKDTTVAKNHYVVINYEGLLDGKPIDGAKADNFLMDMSAPQGIAGLAEGLIGAKPEEERNVTVKFPEDSPSKDLAGKEAIFKVKVIAIKEKQLPKIDDEFAKDLGLESLEVLKARVREGLEQEQKRATQVDLEKQVVEQLLKAHEFAVPKSQVTGQTQQLIEKQINHLVNQGLPQEQAKGMVEKTKAEAEKQAEKDIRLAYILNSIANAESVKATEDEIKAKIEEIVSRQDEKNKSAMLKALRERFVDQIRSDIQEAKLFAWLIENAKVKES